MAPTSIPKLVGQRALLGAVSKVRSEPEQVMRPQAPICRTLSILQRPNSTGPFRRPLPSYLPSDSRFQTQAATSRPFATVTPSSSPMSNSSVISADADAVILGGGVVGLALAASLVTSPRIAGKGGGSDDPLRVVVLEASDLSRLKDWAATQEQTQTHSSAADRTLWENRVVSITLENWLWLEELGVTKFLVHSRIKPVTSMHITDGLSGAALDLADSASAVPGELSKMVELSNLQQAFVRFLDEHNFSGEVNLKVEIRDQTKVESIAPDVLNATVSEFSQQLEAWPILKLATAKQNAHTDSKSLRPRLLIGADGPASSVRKYAGIQKFGWAYGYKGLVGTLRFDASGSQNRGDSVAYQRFLPSGTLAWLPLSSSAASMVWSLPNPLAQLLTELHRADPEKSLLADLVTAAWRLPWASLSYLFVLIEAQTNSEVLRKEIASRLQAASESGISVNEQDCPPPVDVGVDANSVASFPLQVLHAESYLGSSLEAKATQFEGRASLFPDPSSLIRSAVKLASNLAGSQAQKDEVSTHPRGRTVLVGDAAHSMHPLAGQGLNLGLADARSLSRALEEANEVGGDWGSHESLRAYEKEQWVRNQMMLVATDRLHYIYTAPVPSRLDYQGSRQRSSLVGSADSPSSSVVAPLLDAFYSAKVWARSTGVEILNELDSVKDAMRHMAGSNAGDSLRRPR